MTLDRLTLVVLGIISIFVPILALWITRFLRPTVREEQKYENYECGEVAQGDTRVKFKFQYYIIAIIFIVFDIETAVLYPWAVAFRGIGFFAFVEMLIFLCILLVGLAYVWKRGALEWAN